MNHFYLHQPGVVCALGDNLPDIWQRLWQPPQNCLTLSEQWIDGRLLPVGQVNVRLRAWLLHHTNHLHNHINQLLWHACAAIEPYIHAIRQRYSAERIAVIIGTSTSGVDDNIDAFKHVVAGGSWETCGFSQTHQSLASVADFVAMQYDIKGPAYTISTACTSGARALISAARLLRLGLADAVICGGVDCLSALTINGFAALSVLSDSVATPFGPNRQGINIGEAAALFVMTREALDNQALSLLGYGASSDAYHMSSPRPDGLGAQKAIQSALQQAGLTPSDIGWINAHGTGTTQNDAMESKALAAQFGANVPCTSTKPHTGHTLAAAGALEAALIWAAVSRQINAEGRLPMQHLPNGYDPELPHLALTGQHSHWLHSRRIGLSTSFAFGGNNAVLIIGNDT